MVSSKYTLVWGTYKDVTTVGVTTLEIGQDDSSLSELPALPAGQGPTWINNGPNDGSILVCDASEIRLYDFELPDNATEAKWTLRSTAQPAGWKRIVHGVPSRDGRSIFAVDYGASQARSFSFANGSVHENAVSTIHYPGQGGYAPLQYAAHPHGIYEHPSKPLVYVSDMGTDQVHVHALSPDGELKHLSSASTPPASGPRHLAIHPSGKALYTVNEISLTVSTFAINVQDGSLTRLGEDLSILPPNIKLENPGFNKADGGRGMQGAEILIPRDGKHLYATYRDSPDNAHDGIAIFDIELSAPFRPIASTERFASTLGFWPRGMQFEPKDQNLLAVANQESSLCVIFRRDAASGNLTPVAQRTLKNTRRPTTVVWI